MTPTSPGPLSWVMSSPGSSPKVHGPVPVTRQMTKAEVGGEYESETGSVIVETLEKLGLTSTEMPGALVASHGPFTWGRDAQEAADNATALETIAAMASRTLALNPAVGPAPEYLLERHFLRKHGPNAYYGQRRK